MAERIASGRQLWRLNEAGRLRLVETRLEVKAEPITSSQASEVLSEVMPLQSLVRAAVEAVEREQGIRTLP